MVSCLALGNGWKLGSLAKICRQQHKFKLLLLVAVCSVLTGPYLLFVIHKDSTKFFSDFKEIYIGCFLKYRPDILTGASKELTPELCPGISLIELSIAITFSNIFPKFLHISPTFFFLKFIIKVNS